MQPAALGRIERDVLLGAAGKQVERQPEFARLQIPQRRVDGGKGNGGDGADGGGMGQKQVRSRQIASISSASRPIREGASVRSISAMTEAPPVPMV